MYLCKTCNTLKPREEMSSPGPNIKPFRCKPCRNAMERQKLKNDPKERERRKARDDRWRKNNPEAAKASDKAKKRRHYEANLSVEREKNRLRIRKYRENDPERFKKYDAEYRKANPEKFQEYYKQHRHKVRARAQVRWQVYSNKITKPSNCEHCGSEADLEGHHHDYSKPLDVVWVCKACHWALHTSK